jgi:adenylosuccinate lyase
MAVSWQALAVRKTEPPAPSARPLSETNSLMNEHLAYDNPLISRYASPRMSRLWGPQRRFSTWRRLWLALAEAQAELGLTAGDGETPQIQPAQLAEMRAHLEDIDFERASELERKLRHDVMAHIHAFGEACPRARGIIHLGATSCFVTDNTDLLLMHEGLTYLRQGLVSVIQTLGRFAQRTRAVPTLGFTHFQPAQFTTVGKRASLWCHDFLLDLIDVEHRLSRFALRGAKGTTGTQASFLTLFRGDHEKVRELDRLVGKKLGMEKLYPVTGQTYTRKVDSQVLDTLSGIGQSAGKLGNDLRLLAHRQEIEEPHEKEQVGSSAMAYKQNPMRSERMCSIARFVSSLPVMAAQTAANQWLERTLDDSAIRRLYIPQAFLAADAILRLAVNICSGIVVNEKVIQRHAEEALPFIATEALLMAAVAKGQDRQVVHEKIRVHSLAASQQVRDGKPNDLLARLRGDEAFAGVSFDEVLSLNQFVGRAPEQVAEFLTGDLAEVMSRAEAGDDGSEITV